MLQSYREAYAAAAEGDSLTVMSPGLGLHHVVQAFVQTHCVARGPLVLVVNAKAEERSRLLSGLFAAGVLLLPRVVDAESAQPERVRLYGEGGVLFVTSRILVVDLLTKKLDPKSVAGVLVLNAEAVTEGSSEGFALRLFRAGSTDSFVRAFSANPTALAGGFSKLTKVMRALFVSKVFLWPRFHATVDADLSTHALEVAELHVHMTPAMVAIQSAIVDAITLTLDDLHKARVIDTSGITVEECLSGSFDSMIRHQLDPHWHRIGARVKGLVEDIKTLRTLLAHLLSYDCVTFLGMLESLRQTEGAFGMCSSWMYTDPAASIFQYAKARVHHTRKRSNEFETPLEENPKWQVLAQVLNEIRTTAAPAAGGQQPLVLVLVNDARTCFDLKEYLVLGRRKFLEKRFGKFAKRAKVEGAPQEEDKDKGKDKGKGKSSKGKGKKRKAFQVVESLLPRMLSREVEDDGGDDGDGDDNEIQASLMSDEGPSALPGWIMLYPTNPSCSTGQDWPGMGILDQVNPNFVVAYDPEPAIVREVEAHKARRPGEAVRLYFMMYQESVERQRYMSSIKREKDAFEQLIREKATMTLPAEQRAKEMELEAKAEEEQQGLLVDARPAGMVAPATARVIVDMREFRSQLPSILHREGFEVVPVTLEIGDYLLSPDVCLERKSVADLFGSFASGRLYTQATNMCRAYAKPVLLIEFDQDKSFSLQGRETLSHNISVQSISSRMTLLALHFPALRILWSRSVFETVKMVRLLKENDLEPAPITPEEQLRLVAPDRGDALFDAAMTDMVRRLPGIDQHNMYKVMAETEDLQDLFSKDKDELMRLMGQQQGAQLYAFVRQGLGGGGGV